MDEAPGLPPPVELVSFVSYGIAPGALLHEQQVLGHAQLGGKRVMMHSAQTPAGGLVVLRIVLLPVSGVAKSAQLEMNSALGNVPRERSVEGIRLLLDRSPANYSEEGGGRVMFLSKQPVSVPANATQPAPAPDSAKAPPN